MPQLKIDLATRILDKRVKVHLVRPGARYAFYEIVEDLEVLPADAPFLQVSNGKMVPPARKIQRELERARVLRDWARQSPSSRPRRPPTGLDRYSLDLVDPTRAAIRTRIRNAANDILWKIPGGTLVVVPSRRLAGEAILAEIYSRGAKRETIEGIGANTGLKFPARRLRNLKKVPMRDLPVSVTDTARTVRVVERIEGHAEDRLLRMYYGDYQRADEHVAGLVSGSEDFDARVLALMIDLHMAIERAVEKRTATQPGEALFDNSILGGPLFHGRVDSPDGRAYLESSSITTFVVKLFMVVASSGVPISAACQAIEEGNVAIVNSQSEKELEVVEASRDALVDFARISGYTSTAAYVEALQNGLDRNAASIAGTAELEE